ncbi:MAG: phosphate transporter, inner rane subunit PstA [Planctomycetaceae bacterium]|nr:phosphate transporter, inner rane subunit PstA [Planctomycetaceae bacterium]
MIESVITTDPHLARRHRWGGLFEWICKLATWGCLVILAVMIIGILINGWPHLSWSFLTSFDSVNNPKTAGIKAGIWGTFWLILLMACFSIPVGIGAAVYLEEYARPNRLTRLIQLNILNLAGVPSIVYGILGITVFGHMFGFFGNAPPREAVWALPFGTKVMTGALTLSLLILPVVIISTQEALRTVPASLRHSSLALGATQWQTIRFQVLPAAMPGILTGIILAVSRAVGESAPLIMVGALSYVHQTPGNISSVTDFFTKPQGIMAAPFDVFTAMPLVIYNWASQSDPVYQSLAAAGIVVLLVVLLLMNTAAVVIRQRFQNWIRW